MDRVVVFVIASSKLRVVVVGNASRTLSIARRPSLPRPDGSVGATSLSVFQPSLLILFVLSLCFLPPLWELGLEYECYFS